ncbi:LOW QUALITY PROTEIN: glutamate receptor ionotropic, kainate 2 [Drosophila sulfurigaster albostrigata]|uniref:LOW QUALITY PROTEIN: glutamate receptor ionotropic, kainate 2 n=1 Tax=Drosophila sulfurigaster albostrigata TaxID=89887 RepID=UPI002D21BAF1|nr:LOW QUALITY PROTEIN: glutamate receptor ionotropic, kainate 2 [Drosophila sulfurigaster albostrigata]
MWQGIAFIWCVWSAFLVHSSLQQQINIGAFFYDNEIELEKEFTDVINAINGPEAEQTFTLNPLIKRLRPEDGSLILMGHACDLIDNGVAAIFGPSSKAASDIVALISNNTGIPHIEFDAADEEQLAEKPNHQMTLNLYPSQLILSKAYADIVQNLGWRKFTVVYDAEDPKASARLQDILQLRELHNDVVRVRKYTKDEDFRVMWKSILGERRIVLDCSSDLLVDLLNTSSEFNLTQQYNNIFLTNLETYNDNLQDLTADNETFAVNITATRLLLNPDPQAYMQQYGYVTQEDNVVSESTETSRTLMLDLLHDSLHLFVQAWRNATYFYPDRMSVPRMSCDFGPTGGRPWLMGRYLARLMKGTSGVNSASFRTSNLQFDEDGQRINFNIEIYDPVDNIGIAIWDTRGQITQLNVKDKVQKKIVYRVATRIGPPYFNLNDTAVALNLTGNAIYQGYAVDLIKAISEEVGFEYVFVPVADQQYGKQDKITKQWNGIIGEIVNNDAHMGICDLTITQARRTAVDFTVPFMQLGVSILAYKSPPKENEWQAYLKPFGGEVWIWILISVFAMSFLKVIIARIAKAEWENPHPCNRDPDALENQWHLHNTFWLTVASIMTAGCDILPRSPQVRLSEATWWIFAIIIANSYTANLAAFLTNSKMEGSITSLKDLSAQTKVKFGTINGGSTYNLLAESNETVYRLAFNLMNKADPSPYTKDNQEGVERVNSSYGDYMFLMETTTLEYHREKSCFLRSVGEKFGEKHYAIAVPFGADYRSNLSVAILKLSERGELFKIKQRWWKQKNNTCVVEADPNATPDMTFSELRGIFYTLYMGILIAFIIGIIEFLVYVQQVALEERLDFKQAFIKEIIFVLRIWNNKKPSSGSTTASSLRSTPLRSIGKSMERTPKSARRIVLGRSSEEMRELPLPPATRPSPSCSGSGERGSEREGEEEEEARV